MIPVLCAIVLGIGTAGTAIPAAEPLDPRLFDASAPSVTPRGPLLEGLSPEPRREREEVEIRLLPAMAVPAGALLSGATTWAGLAGRGGDSGLPLMEIGGGFGGGFAGATLGSFAMFGCLRSDPELTYGYRPFAIPAITTPIGAGLGTWLVARKLEGESPHETEALLGAIAGAAAGELLFVGSVVLTKSVAGGPAVWLAFVPVGAGATLGYRLARGPSGRDAPLWKAPVRLTVVF